MVSHLLVPDAGHPLADPRLDLDGHTVIHLFVILVAHFLDEVRLVMDVELVDLTLSHEFIFGREGSFAQGEMLE